MCRSLFRGPPDICYWPLGPECNRGGANAARLASGDTVDGETPLSRRSDLHNASERGKRPSASVVIRAAQSAPTAGIVRKIDFRGRLT